MEESMSLQTQFAKTYMLSFPTNRSHKNMLSFIVKGSMLSSITATVVLTTYSFFTFGEAKKRVLTLVAGQRFCGLCFNICFEFESIEIIGEREWTKVCHRQQQQQPQQPNAHITEFLLSNKYCFIHFGFSTSFPENFICNTRTHELKSNVALFSLDSFVMKRDSCAYGIWVST